MFGLLLVVVCGLLIVACGLLVEMLTLLLEMLLEVDFWCLLAMMLWWLVGFLWPFMFFKFISVIFD